MTGRDYLTRAAGAATAAAIESITRDGIEHPRSEAAMGAALALVAAAERAGATIPDIRRAGGLPTEKEIDA